MRNLEHAVTTTYVTKYMTQYTDDPENSEEVKQKELYPILTSSLAMMGPLFCNWSTYLLMKVFGEENPMSIPYVCMFRMTMTLPGLALLFLLD